MEVPDFDSLQHLLTPINLALKNVISELGYLGLEPIRQLIGEISRSSSTSGIFQFVGEEARELVLQLKK